MSIQSQIDRINTNIANAYDAVVTMGGTIPQTQNTANLPDAIATLAQTDYIQLEWIEGTGTQYIDTLITPTSTYKIQVVASNHSNDDTPFFGAYTSWAVNSLLCYGVTINGNQRVYSEGQYSGNNFINHNITSSTPYTITLDYTSMTVNNSSVTFSNMGRINTTLKIFWGGERISKFRLYSAKVWNGNTLVVDYIPALKKSTCEVGLYDKVTNTFYGNSGLGYFRPGIKIAGYSILDYLQSSGAAWFDTGVSGGSKMEYSMAINTLGSKARNYEQYFAGDNSPVTHKVYMNGTTNTSPVLIQQANGVYWSGTSTNTLTLYNNADAWHNISFYSDGKLYLDTTLKGTGANNGWGTLSYYVFNSHSEPTLISSMRLFQLVMKTDGDVVRFYIPTKRASDNKYGFYDLVNNTFSPSASNTAFTAGSVSISNDGTNSPYYSLPVVVPTPSTKSGSIADQIDRINENIANSYDVCEQLGRSMPDTENSYYLRPTILQCLPSKSLYYRIRNLSTTQELHYALDLSDTKFTWEYSDATSALTATSSSDVPWYSNSHIGFVKEVTFETVIAPQSTAYWFYGFSNLNSFINPELLDTRYVTTMTHMFYGNNLSNNAIQIVTNFDTSNVTDMSYMFYTCNRITYLDLGNWNTSKVTNMQGMFRDCNIATLYVNSWDTSNVTNMGYMFWNCSNLRSFDLRSWKSSGTTDMNRMFGGDDLHRLTLIDLSNFDMSGATLSYRWNVFSFNTVGAAYCRSASDKAILDQMVVDSGGSWTWTVKTYKPYFVTWKNYNNQVLRVDDYDLGDVPNYGRAPIKPSEGDYDYVFNGWNPTITSVSGDEEYIAQYTPTKEYRFLYYKIDNGALYLRNNECVGYSNGFRAINATRSSGVPWKNNSVSSITIEQKIVPHTCNYWFEDTYPTPLITAINNLSNLDTSNVTSMQSMFHDCGLLTSIDVSNFDTSNVTNMGHMFAGCTSIISLDLTNFDTSNVTLMQGMFQRCTSLTYLDLSSFDMSNCTGQYSLTDMFLNTPNVTTAYCRTQADKTILDAACQQSGVNWRFTVKS